MHDPYLSGTLRPRSGPKISTMTPDPLFRFDSHRDAILLWPAREATRIIHKAKGLSRSLSDIAVRDKTKEVQADARPQVSKNQRRIHWNTLRIFLGREQSRCLDIVRHRRTGRMPSDWLAVPLGAILPGVTGRKPSGIPAATVLGDRDALVSSSFPSQ